jgi:limonene-1,2-epoxide hydrolase
MGNFAQATTGSTGHRLLHGLDVAQMRNSETGRRIDIWGVKTAKWYLYHCVTEKGKKTKRYNYNPRLGDLGNTKFEVLARHAVCDGAILTEPVDLQVGSRVMRLTVNGKTYLLSGGRVHKR